MSNGVDCYRSHSPFTDTTGVDQRLLQGLPTTTEELCALSPGLIVHEYLAGLYGVGAVSGRLEELEKRTFAEQVEAITALDPAPLAVCREPGRRLVGNCRQHAVFTCSLLRDAGLPARVRAGFSGYFDDTWVDHWIVERWDEAEGGWIRTDTQLDATQRDLFQIDFDPLHVPTDKFLTGSEAWVRCRRGDDDPERFGIQEMRGWWFIACNLIRDLAALNKVELHVWDTWGIMDRIVFARLTPEHFDLVDRVAAAITSGDQHQIRAVFQHEDLAVPDTVTSHRFQRKVEVAAPART